MRRVERLYRRVHDEECPLYTAPEKEESDESDSSVEESAESSSEKPPVAPAENQNSIGAEVPDAPVVEDEAPAGPTEVSSGTCGTNVTWTLTDDGTLTISGSGKIDDKSARNPAPWNAQGYTEQISEVVIEEGITQIGGYAFYQCVNLEKVTLPFTLTNIGGYSSNTFASCSSLASIEIPASVTTIKASSFAGCTALASITIPSGVKKIEKGTFSGCAALTGIVIPENVTEIGSSAFNGCTGLTSVTIPAAVKTVGDMAFQNCSNLSSVTFAEGSVLYTLHNTAFNGTAIKTLTIPSGTWNMNSGIYGNLPELKAIIFEGVPAVTSANTFKNLDISQLTAYVYSVQDYNKLIATKAIATSQGGKPFGTYVLVNEGETIDKEGILVKDGYEFQAWSPVEGSEGLVSAVWAEPAPEVIGGYCGKYTPGTDAQWTFDPATGVLSITGTGWTKEYYARNPAPWSEYKEQITEVVIGEGITSIGGYSFDKCANLTKVTLPSTLENIGGYSSNTFAGCTALTSVVIPENVTNISGYAFSGCTGLTEITIPGKVTSFGSGIFSGCTGLIKVTLTNGLKETPDFTNCTGLTELVIPDTVTKMGSLAGCSNLRSINLPSGLKVLPVLAGTAIETLMIPQNTTLSDANGKLANCKNLTTIVGNLLSFNANQAKNLFKGTDVSKITVYAYLYPNQKINNLLSRLSVDYMRDNAKGIYLVRPDETLTQSEKGEYVLVKDGYVFDGWEWIDTFGNVVEAGAADAKIQQAKWTCAEHTWNDGEVTLEPTCTTDGTKTYTCMVCGETTTETIDQLGHNTDGTVAHKDATCTEDGVVGGTYCTRCNEGKAAAEAVIAKLGHTVAIDPAVEATCTEAGKTEGKHCSVCGEIIQAQETVPAKGHTLTHVDAKAATTEAAGNIEYWHCTACDKYFRDAQATQEITLADTVLDRLTSSVPSGSGSSSVTTYRLTINYVFEDGTQAADAVRRSLSSGSSYSVSSPAVEGYTPDQSVVEGRLSGNLTVTVTYIKDQDVQDPDTPLTGAPVDTVFADIAKDAWYTAAIQHVYDKGWMSGISSTSFAPNDNTTRGMIVTVLHRMENKPGADKCGFTDVADGKYYTYAVNWAASQGVITGYDSGLFGPEDQITREQMVVILYRYAAKTGYDVTARADLSVFSDADQISAYAKEAMSWANAMGLVVGTSETTLSPTDKVTRAQMAMLLTRFENTFEKTVVA